MTIPYRPAATLADRLLDGGLVSRIWERDIGAWSAQPASADAQSIRTRLGWLDVGRTMEPHLPALRKLAAHVKDQAFETVYLLGMGGSSLCAEVIRSVYGVAEGHPDVVVLDTTDETTIRTAAARMNPRRTLFLVASKSGTTVEVASLERFFWNRMADAVGDGAGRHFLAITDPGTALQQLAEERRYQAVFLNPPDIGGRFSALSLFGLVPASLIGAPFDDMLEAGKAMAEGCRQESHANPGFELGAFFGGAALEGRDKLTVALAPSLASLGPWIEQLVAESTGKHGKGVLPVVDEPLGPPGEYGSDRAFVAVSSERDTPDFDKLDALEAAGHPVLRLTTRMDGLGAEFFRWEFATAVAGAALGINPFDEPNVAEAKQKTKALLATFAERGTLREESPAAASGSVQAFTRAFAGSSPAAVLRAALDSLRPHDYVAFLSYLPGASGVGEAVAGLRRRIRQKYRVATTFGIGPRYLHSTGQYHKGGPNTALAILITADDETETEIPGAGYSFRVLKQAQALGDAETLEAHDRRTVRIHLTAGATAAPAILMELFEEGFR